MRERAGVSGNMAANYDRQFRQVTEGAVARWQPGRGGVDPAPMLAPGLVFRLAAQPETTDQSLITGAILLA